jgi:PleD family two-component response regulator
MDEAGRDAVLTAVLTQHPDAAESLIARADAAMYEAKRTGAGRRLSLVLADA